MNIVFLDADTTDRGDLDWSALENEGSLTRHPLSHASDVPARVAGATVIISNKVPITAAVLDAAPLVRLVVSAATGVNQIDIEACRARGIAVANVAGYSTSSVAQHTFALILEIATRSGLHATRVRADWPASPCFTRLDHPLVELAGKTLGIIGLGAIGRAVARIAQAMEMNVVALARSPQPDSGDIPRLAEGEFLATSDIVSLHCPLTPETQRFLDEERIGRMKAGVWIINTGRGALIDEPALANALRSGRVGAAGLDVLTVEPPPADHPLLAEDIPNLFITPHTAWTTREARERLLAGIVADIRAFKAGETLNRIV